MSKSNKSKVESSIQDLMKALSAGQNSTTKQIPNQLNATDLSLAYAHMFTPASKRGMSNNIQALVYKREIKRLMPNTYIADKVHYFTAIAVGDDKIVKAARIISNDINRLSAMGYVTGCLAKLSCLKLATEPHQLDEYIVFAYVSLSPEGSNVIAQSAELGEEDYPSHNCSEDGASYAFRVT